MSLRLLNLALPLPLNVSLQAKRCCFSLSHKEQVDTYGNCILRLQLHSCRNMQGCWCRNCRVTCYMYFNSVSHEIMSVIHDFLRYSFLFIYGPYGGKCLLCVDGLHNIRHHNIYIRILPPLFSKIQGITPNKHGTDVLVF